MVCPEEAGIGAQPASRAKAASLRTRPGWDQESSSCAAASVPTPGSSSRCGASCQRVGLAARAAFSPQPANLEDVLAPSGEEAGQAAAWWVKDLASELQELRERGVRIEEYDQPGLNTVDGVADLGFALAAWIVDPGGNCLGILQLK